MRLNDEIEAAGIGVMQALLFGFATAKTDGLTAQDLVEAVIGRELTIAEASYLVEQEQGQYDAVMQIIGSPLQH